MRCRDRKTRPLPKAAGLVVRGEGRGRTMGFPTVNVEVAEPLPEGVYAAWVTLGDERRRAAVHVGPPATFGKTRATVEAHLLDFSGDCSGESAQIELVRRLRGVETFTDARELARQIAKDVERAADILKEKG